MSIKLKPPPWQYVDIHNSRYYSNHTHIYIVMCMVQPKHKRKKKINKVEENDITFQNLQNFQKGNNSQKIMV